MPAREIYKQVRVHSDNPQTISVETLRDIIEQIEDDYSIEKTRWSMDDVPR